MRIPAWISAIFPEKKASPDTNAELSRAQKDLRIDWTQEDDVDGPRPEAVGSNLFERIEGIFSSLWQRVLAFFGIRKEASDNFSAHLQAQPNAPSPEAVLHPITKPAIGNDKDGFSFVPREALGSVPQPQKLEAPVDIGMLGSIPAPKAYPVDELQGLAEEVKASPGKIKFADYLQATSEGLDVSEFFLDQDCIDYARGIATRAAGLAARVRPLDSEDKAVISAAKNLLELRSEHDRRIREEEARLAKEAERKREMELLASKQPGQKDFEDFVVLFEKHRSDNTPLILVPGSRFLSTACIDYASSLSDDRHDREAVRFLELWARNLDGSLAAMKAADHFMEPPPPRRLPPRVAVTEPEPVLTTQAMRKVVDSFGTLDDAARAEMLAGTTLTSDSFGKALRALQHVVREEGIAAGATRASSVEFRLNYARQAEDAFADTMEALDLAEYVLNHCKARSDGFAFMKSFRLQPGWIDGLLDEVRKARQKLQETRLAQRSQSAAKEPRRAAKEPQRAPREPATKVATAEARAEPRTVSAESMKLLLGLKESIDGPGLMLAMYSNPQLAPNIPQIYEGALPYFESLIISGKVDDAAKANAQLLASFWQSAKRDRIQLEKMRALPDFASLDAVFDLEKIDRDFS